MGEGKATHDALHMNGFGKRSRWRMDMGMWVLRPVDRKGVACLGVMKLSLHTGRAILEVVLKTWFGQNTQ